MSFSRPTLAELIERTVSAIETTLDTTAARLRRSNLNVLARVNAAAAHGLYGFVAWVAKQILPDTADDEILERHASIWLKTPRIPASYATGSVTVTGSIGAVIEAGTVFIRGDGQRYEADAEVSLATISASIAITALEFGAVGNADAGTALTMESPVANVQPAASVIELSGGADIESIASLRARVLARIRQTPMSGADYDYLEWALDVPGVTRAWVYPKELGAGTVTLRFVRDNDANLIPDAGEVATVQAYIDSQSPVTADAHVFAPLVAPTIYKIALTPDLVAVRAAVEAELRDLHRREAVPGGTLLISHIREAISLAAGEKDHVLLAPTANVVCATGYMATYGGVEWV